MRGLLMKDLELIKINMSVSGGFLIGLIYLVAHENGSTFFVAYAIFVSIGVSVGTISYDGYHHGMKFLKHRHCRSQKSNMYSQSICSALVLQYWSVLSGYTFGDDKNTDFGKQEAEDLLISASTASLFPV